MMLITMIMIYINYLALPVALLVLVVPLQLLVTSYDIINTANAMMKHVTVDRVGVFVVGFVRTERRLALGHRYDTSRAVNTRLPVAHLLLVVPDELLRALNRVVDACQAVVIDVAEFRVGEISVET